MRDPHPVPFKLVKPGEQMKLFCLTCYVPIVYYK